MKMSYESPMLIFEQFTASITDVSDTPAWLNVKNGQGANNPNCWGRKSAALEINEDGDLCT